MSEGRGLLFDMDGLLFDTERVGERAFVEISAPLGMDEAAARAQYRFFVGGSSKDTNARLEALFPNADSEALQQEWIKAFERGLQFGVPLRPTVGEIVPALAKAGYRMAVVTSSWRAHARHNLAQTGLDAFFEGVVAGDDVTAMKPDPEPYLKGAALLGHAPEACIAFEDSDPGITAAMGAGCVGVQIPDLRPPEKPFPDLGQRFAATLEDAVMELGLLPAFANSAL
ncbi:MAG: HAD family phosphatase [Pseudomonadota bacterium]